MGLQSKSCILFSNSLNQINVERCGRAFFLYNRYQNYGTTLDQFSDDNSSADRNSKIADVDIEFLRSLDPKACKDQDHYAVLGLKSSRFFATDDDIRQAFRKMVLKHHPDKRKAIGEEINQETDYFTCITKAYEILGNFKARRSYDSVDPQFSDLLPTSTEIEKDFFGTFNEAFSVNSRWSEKKNVPTIGHIDSSREEVEHFYSFWYEFNSWREYSYLDEEDKEKGQDREERRWIEKQNKAARIKRKKEEMARIRSLVDLAYNNDPRIVKFKNEEKERKNAAKKAKMNAAQAAKAEQDRILKEAQLAKEAFEKAEQKRIEQARIEKEQLKKSFKKEKKSLRDKLKENDFYSATIEEKIKNMEGVEKICEVMKLNELQELNRELEQGNKEFFFKSLVIIESKLEEERSAHLSNNNNNNNNNNTSINNCDNATLNGRDKTNKEDSLWTKENVQLLIKAVNLFPAGTNQRWEVIATFMNQHSGNSKCLKARDVLSKAKGLQSGDFSKNLIKSELNESAFESFEKHVKKVGKVKIDQPSDQTPTENGIDNNLINENSSSSNKKLNQNSNDNWTKEEQALLEQAIKTYPLTTMDRWDRIAECVPNRSKKDCLKRVKTLVDRINAKKEVQQSVK